MDDLKHLREKRGSLAKQMKDLYDKAKAEERGLSADERTQWDKMSDDVSNYDADIKRFEDLEKVSGELGKTFERKADERQISRDEAKDRSGKAFRNFLLSRIGLADFTDENKRDLFENPFKEFRTNAQSTTDAKGGYTIPEGFSNELAIAMKAWGGMTEVARILRTASGNDIPWPATNDTANVAYQVDEAASLETSASDATFSKAVTLKAYKWTSGLVRVSPEILTDSYFDFERILIDLCIWNKLKRYVFRTYYAVVCVDSVKPTFRGL
jgi:HK97 family phage major capsid protein